MIPIRYNVRSVVERRATSLMTILGVGMVAMIFVILFGFIGGLQSTLLNAGGERNWILLNRGAPQENASIIGRGQFEILRVLPELAVNDDGAPLISPEALAAVNLSRDKRFKQFVTLRGVTPIAYQVHRNLRLVSGHWPLRSDDEWVIGQKVAVRYPFLVPGTQFHYDRHQWNVVGIFSDAGSARESEIWTDNEDLRVEKHWKLNANILHVALKPGTAEAFKQALRTDGRLTIDPVAESDYYAAQSKIAGQLRSLGLVVAIALAIGATFGGMNTMYTAVARREREIGVLRVLGFSRGNILGSFVLESALLGLGGGIVGVILSFVVAWITGLDSRLMSVGTLFFSYRPDVAAISAGLVAAIVIGVLGGLLPAWHAARIGIIDSIREA
jgi:putative ABC transport system permease protein